MNGDTDHMDPPTCTSDEVSSMFSNLCLSNFELVPSRGSNLFNTNGSLDAINVWDGLPPPSYGLTKSLRKSNDAATRKSEYFLTNSNQNGEAKFTNDKQTALDKWQQVQTILKQVTALKFIINEHFQSAIDKAAYRQGDDFEKFLQRNTTLFLGPTRMGRNLCVARKTLGKLGRGGTPTIIMRYRSRLEKLRRKIRVLQLNPSNQPTDPNLLAGLPRNIPPAISVGSKVKVRVYGSSAGLYNGTVLDVNVDDLTYQIRFDRLDMGTRNVSGADLLETGQYDMASKMNIPQNSSSHTDFTKASLEENRSGLENRLSSKSLMRNFLPYIPTLKKIAERIRSAHADMTLNNKDDFSYMRGMYSLKETQEIFTSLLEQTKVVCSSRSDPNQERITRLSQYDIETECNRSSLMDLDRFKYPDCETRKIVKTYLVILKLLYNSSNQIPVMEKISEYITSLEKLFHDRYQEKVVELMNILFSIKWRVYGFENGNF